MSERVDKGETAREAGRQARGDVTSGKRESPHRRTLCRLMSVKMDKWCTLLLSSFLMQMGGQWTPLLGKAEMLRHMPQTGTDMGAS
jgi:hypothetical protein